MRSRISSLAIAILLTPLAATFTLAQPAHINLADYRLTSTINLPVFVDESSAISYNPDTGNLYIIGDEGLGIGEFSRTGTYLGAMTFTGFEDTEGIAYAGGGRFVIAEERLQDLFILTYTRFGAVARSSLQSVSLGATTDNVGIEGVCFEPRSGLYFAVKEKSPARVMQAIVSFPAAAATPTDLFAPASLGVTDLADIAILSTLPSLIGTADQDNLLIISQESARVVEVTRTGVVQSTLSLAGIATTAEGVTIDERGTIFIVDETPRLFIFERECTADFNDDGMRDVPDIFAFLAAWFAAHPAANFDGLNGIAVPDIFAFLSEWFAGC